MEHKLFIKSITHQFGERRILSEISFESVTGKVTGIFGRNGSGKSTLFKILFGTLKPTQASIYFNDRLFTGLNSFIGYHTQEIMLPKRLKVKNLIGMYIDNAGQNKVYYAPGIYDMQHKNVSDLSIGQQRYLQLLLLLNLNHPFIILDEPFSMVEPLYKNLIKQLIIDYKPVKGFIVTDHYYLDVFDIADESFLIKDGNLIPISERQKLIDLKYLSDQAIIY